MVAKVIVSPQEWNEKIFSEISSMNGRIGWQGLKQSEFSQNPENPFLITGMNFKDGVIHWNEVYHIPETRYEEAKNIQLKEEDILMTKDGTIGKILFIDNIPHPNKASLNSHLLLFRPIAKQYVPKFLFYQLLSKSFLDHIEQNKSGTTFFGITEKAIGKFKINLPPIAEQKNISKSLSDTYDLIRDLEILIKKKKNIRQGTTHELLTGERKITKTGEWKEKKLGDICEFENGDRGKNYPSKSIQTKVGIPFVNAGHLANSREIDFKKMDYIPNEAYDLLSNGKIKQGDVLFCLRGSLGKFSGVENIGKGAIASSLIIVRPNKSNQIISEFILILFGNKKTSKLIEIYEGGNAQPNLSADNLKKFGFLIPPIEEQKAIANILSDMDSEIQELEQKRDKYIMIKNGMMQKLLTGEIRLT